MNIKEIYQSFPTELSCIEYLERVRWKNSPICPYCKSCNSSPLPREYRHHCNICNTSFSVTTKSIFHRSHLPLQKWFFAISLVLNAKDGISSRQLSREVQVNKDTAWLMAMRIRQAMREQNDLLLGIVAIDETYIAGKQNPNNDDPNRNNSPVDNLTISKTVGGC